MALILDEQTIYELADMDKLINVLEDAQIEFSKGKAIQPLRSRFEISPYPGFLDLMPGYLENIDALSIKVLTSRKNNPNAKLPIIIATVFLMEAETGRLKAIMDGGSLTALRTAAVSGVATRHLARKDASCLAIIGTGRQARTHLWAMTTVRQIQKILAHDPEFESAQLFKREMEDRFNIPIALVPSAEEAVKKADIIVLSTTTTDPVLFGDRLKAGMHINSIASATPQVRELDTAAIVKSKVIVDSKKSAMLESGDLLVPISEGKITTDHVYAEIGEIASGEKLGRTSDKEITLYKSMGLAIQDTAAANWFYSKASELGRGINLEL